MNAIANLPPSNQSQKLAPSSRLHENLEPKTPIIGSSLTMKHHQQQQLNYQAAANDLARRHYAQTISRASNLSHLQLLGRYQQQLCYPPTGFAADSRTAQQQQQQQQLMLHQKYATFSNQQRHSQQVESLLGVIERQARLNKPLCRCRVMYLGSSVPHITKNGLHGIQEPLRHLYPDEQFNNSAGSSAARTQPGATTIDISHLSSELGIDSWLSVWSNGLLLENVDDFGRDIKRFFSIESLHYCAAVRFFDASSLVTASGKISAANDPPSSTPDADQNNNSSQPACESHEKQQDQEEEILRAPTKRSVVRFLPLDAPLFQCPGMVDAKHPPMFAAILRRTSGIKVLECHAFICRRDAAANALVRCCTHAYADLLSARRVSAQLEQLGRDAAHLHKPSAGSSATSHLSLARRSWGRHLDEATKTRAPAAVGGGGGGERPLAGSKQHRMRHEATKGGATTKPLKSSSASDSADSSLIDEAACNATNSSAGDDNYAIISRHQSRANSRGPAACEPLVAACKRAATAKSSSRRAAAGSSRSLFNDFMPSSSSSSNPTQSAEKTSADEPPPTVRLLSHSMDLLRMRGDDDDEGNGQKDISGRHEDEVARRHSKSMQNLADFARRQRSLSSSRGSLGSGSASTSHSRTQQTTSTHNRRRRRPLARDQRPKRSLQDIRRPSSCRSEPPEPAADPMRGERLPAPPPGDNSNDREQIYDKPAPAATNYYERIEAPRSSTTATSSRKRERSRSGRAPKRTSAANKPIDRHGTSADHQQQQPPHLVGPLYAAPSLAPQFVQAAHLPPPPPPPPVQLHQMPTAQQMPALQMPLLYPLAYPGVPLDCGAPYGGPGGLKYPPPMPVPLAAPHPGYCLAPSGYPYETLVGQQRLLAANYFAAPPAAAAGALATLGHRKRKQQASLATTFRCLSPPLNFIARQAPTATTNLGNATPPARRRPASTEQLPASSSDNPNGPAELVSVVSGQPGFISHSAAAAAATTSGASNGKRLSWIKRLSLTMGGSSSSPAAATTATPPPPPAEQDSQRREKKRSSRLFVGSLTLGRATKNKPPQKEKETEKEEEQK